LKRNEWKFWRGVWNSTTSVWQLLLKRNEWKSYPYLLHTLEGVGLLTASFEAEWMEISPSCPGRTMETDDADSFFWSGMNGNVRGTLFSISDISELTASFEAEWMEMSHSSPPSSNNLSLTASFEAEWMEIGNHTPS